MRHKLRKINPTVHLVGEGASEEYFLKHIKQNYFDRHKQSIRIPAPYDAGGGSPWKPINKAISVSMGLEDNNKTIVLIDSASKKKLDENIIDRDLAFKKCEQYHITIIWLEPCCLEGFILRLLGEPEKKIPFAEQQCKDAWKVYSGDRKLNDLKTYEKYFPKSALEKMRKTNTILDRVIRIME